MTYFRKNIDDMAGYKPGEQPRDKRYVKLNTNENPYPPAPGVSDFLKNIDYSLLRLYPDPVFKELRIIISEIYGTGPGNVLVGNGSDDILTIAIRSFTGNGRKLACFKPSYSLYPILAKIQDCECEEIQLDASKGFSLPPNFSERIRDAALLIVCRPNAPTGNTFQLEQMERICESCKGIVLIDEAYADFADDNCIGFMKKYSNIIVMRTLSKSYSLAGLRLGFALASEGIIDGMMKVKDSYNVSMLAQKIAVQALSDRKYMSEIVSKIKEDRKFLAESLRQKNFVVFESQSNFILAGPPDGKAKELYEFLKSEGVLVRYFPGADTEKFIRITVGTRLEIEALLKLL